MKTDENTVMTWLEICGKNKDCSSCCPYGNGKGEKTYCKEDLMSDAFELLKDYESMFENISKMGDASNNCSFR